MATRRGIWTLLAFLGLVAGACGAQAMELRRSAFVGAGRAGDRVVNAVLVIGDPVVAVSRAGPRALWHGFLGPLGLSSAGVAWLQPGLPALAPIVPNPASSGATIRFRAEGARPVAISVYDLAGRRVRRLVDAAAGDGALRWDLDDDDGLRLPSGLYFVRLEADRLAAVRPVMIVD